MLLLRFFCFDSISFFGARDTKGESEGSSAFLEVLVRDGVKDSSSTREYSIR